MCARVTRAHAYAHARTHATPPQPLRGFAAPRQPPSTHFRTYCRPAFLGQRPLGLAVAESRFEVKKSGQMFGSFGGNHYLCRRINSNNMEETKVTMKPNGLEMDINKQEFALALKTWRLRQGLTQKQVGEMWGCSRWTIMRAEAGKDITWEMAYRMFAKLSHELRKEAENG